MGVALTGETCRTVKTPVSPLVAINCRRKTEPPSPIIFNVSSSSLLRHHRKNRRSRAKTTG
ncbi:hypothetical protein Hanom_Chr00s000002g01599261 [Helianthus anomalus]